MNGRPHSVLACGNHMTYFLWHMNCAIHTIHFDEYSLICEYVVHDNSHHTHALSCRNACSQRYVTTGVHEPLKAAKECGTS